MSDNLYVTVAGVIFVGAVLFVLCASVIRRLFRVESRIIQLGGGLALATFIMFLAIVIWRTMSGNAATVRAFEEKRAEQASPPLLLR